MIWTKAALVMFNPVVGNSKCVMNLSLLPEMYVEFRRMTGFSKLNTWGYVTDREK
jgi:hypothetical protein